MSIRSFTSLAVLLSIGMAAHASTVYSTSFEAPTFTTGTLAGQNGFSGSSVGQVESGRASTGTQAVVFSTVGTTGQNLSFLNETTASSLIQLQTSFLYTASAFDYFDVLAASGSDHGPLDQILVQGGYAFLDNGTHSNMITVSPNVWYTYTLNLDFTSQMATFS